MIKNKPNSWSFFIYLFQQQCATNYLMNITVLSGYSIDDSMYV